jgi:hypothetical protein
MSEKPQIVQVEFFLVKTGADQTLSKVVQEAVRRTLDGVQIKEGVRFYDTGGRIAKLLVEAKRAKAKHREYYLKTDSRFSLVRRFNHARSRSWQEQVDRYVERARIASVERIAELARSTKQLAIERLGHAYTMAKPEELHELVERLRKSDSAWFFVFEHNTLTADKNKIVESVSLI